MNGIDVDISRITIVDLEKLITEYPWFSFAREELFTRLAENGPDFTEEQLKKCSAFISVKDKIYYKAAEFVKNEREIPVIDFDEINKEIVIDEHVEVTPGNATEKNEPRYIILGGDYFTKEDMDSLEDMQTFSVGKLGSVDERENIDYKSVKDEDGLDELDGFYTETLAQIYAQQGHYEEAMKVYAKLILLYPEKSTYFATLVKKVKSKNN